jgi:hypothetical protein
MKIFTAALAVALLLSMGGCKKNKNNPASGLTGLTGTWRIQLVQGGMSTARTFSPTNDSLLIFTDKNFTFTAHGQVLRSGTYSVLNDDSFNALVVPAGQFKRRIVYSDDSFANTRKIFFQVSGDQLTFLSGDFALDSGVEEVYGRLI